jgi:DNA-binding response OmpR family regulator
MPEISILIVEDDPLFQGVYRTRLEQQGYKVTVAGDGEEALKAIEQSPPDLILLDLVLPRLSGLEVLGRLRQDPQQAAVPVIILTSRGEPADIERGKQAGANDYLIKGSTNPREVIWKVKQALAKESGEPVRLRVALQEKELDAAALADLAQQSNTLQCAKCRLRLVMELTEQKDRPGWFDARLICPECDK